MKQKNLKDVYNVLNKRGFNECFSTSFKWKGVQDIEFQNSLKGYENSCDNLKNYVNDNLN